MKTFKTKVNSRQNHAFDFTCSLRDAFLLRGRDYTVSEQKKERWSTVTFTPLTLEAFNKMEAIRVEQYNYAILPPV